MTPNELLETVRARFTVLLHDDEQALNALLRKAIGKYQDLAGFMVTKKIDDTPELRESGEVAAATNIISRICVKDSTGRFVPSELWGETLELQLSGRETYPLRFTYFESVLSADFDVVKLPASSTTLIADYLELLITIPNTERQRRIAIAGKLDASDMPTEEVLAARKLELEQDIKASRAMLPTFSLF
jgi:hypothetical protein